MKDSIHQNQDSQYSHSSSNEERKRIDENDVVNPRARDVTEDESILEVDEAAGSAEGMSDRNDGLNLDKDVREDREDNNEERLPDIPSSAIIR